MPPLDLAMNQPDAAVTAVTWIRGTVGVRPRFNVKDEHDDVPVHNADSSLFVSDRCEATDGFFYCRFNQKKVVDNAKIFNLTEPHYLLLATGTVSDCADKFDYHGENHLHTDERVNLSNYTAAEDGRDTLNQRLIWAHGSLMLIGWWVLISMGIFIGRYFKNILTRDVAGSQLWFQIHRCFNFTAVLVVIAAFILIVIQAGGSFIAMNNPSRKYHASFGLATVILCLIQPVLGILRPNLASAIRPLFNNVHRIFGFLALLGSVVTVLMLRVESGFSYLSQDNKPLGVLIFYFLFVIISMLLMDIDRMKHKGRVLNYTLKDLSDTPDRKSACFPMMMLALYPVVCSAVAGIMIHWVLQSYG